jgi:hypothetical protein
VINAIKFSIEEIEASDQYFDHTGGVLPKFSLSYATALHRCESCPSKCACRKWLDRMPDSVSFAPPFCPNVDIFFELQVDQQGVAHITGEHVSDTWR